MKSLAKLSIFFLLAVLMSSVVHAHIIGGSGLGDGILHPLTGFDHLLAMVAVGIISIQLSGKSKWFAPATFISFMIIGGALAIFGISFPYVQTGIALSVLVLGALIAVAKPISRTWMLMIVGMFALFHGHVHGEEMSVIVSPFFYSLGFVISTLLLHVSGMLVGHYAMKTELNTKLLRITGAAMSASGLVFLLFI